MAMNDPAGPHRVGRPAPEPDDEHLPCGRLLSEAWAARDTPTPDPHDRTCPHCAAARDELDRLGDLVRGLPGHHAPAPQDTAALTERVMDVVRLELRPGRTLPLGAPDEDAWIVEAAAAKTLRTAAETVAGVQAGSCRIAPAGGPTGRGATGPTETARGPVDIRIEVLVPFESDLLELASRVRDRILEAADVELGLPVAAVDVRVADVYGPHTDGEAP
ncbi:Asp23/Gls24 family envelope stress response protein [Streptomyces albulus]|uniref:Asp23/Gls24 family envelope stress response protein n=1 Tax=Streptomyces noursei TaxID=1971 RepID=UPI001F346E45|nr:Asp23/Gls24 family envelope stress response protein [Streptomyces noursei]MCE4941541.1 Asp23/Gls24 family envelope stress response protein [Streptomyces noursei]